jgi:hypothetical protein
MRLSTMTARKTEATRVRFFGTLAATLLAICFASSTTPASAAPARPASAYGATAIGSFAYSVGGVTVNVPVGCYLDHQITGKGDYINYENASTVCIGAGTWGSGFCNAYMQFVFERTNGTTWDTVNEPIHYGCTHFLSQNAATFENPQGAGWSLAGKHCANLVVDGHVRASQCHYIFP